MTTNEFKQKIVPLSPRIFPMAARILNNDEEAQDAVQEIMIKLWKKRKQLNNHPNVSGFVFLSARNYCLDQLKKKKPYQTDRLNSGLIADYYVDEKQEESEDVFMIVRKIIAALPENQREIILMKDLDGFEFDEIVAVTNLKLEHIRVLLSRARKYVRTQLRKTEL